MSKASKKTDDEILKAFQERNKDKIAEEQADPKEAESAKAVNITPEQERALKPVNELLKEYLEGKNYSTGLIIGLRPDGVLDINATDPYFDKIQWLLTRSQVELVLMENQSIQNRKNDTK